MSQDLSGAFERLKSSADRLNRATDSAAQVIRDVESFLESQGVALSSETLAYTCGRPDDEPEGWVNLEYRHIANKFRVAVVHYHNGEHSAEVTLARPWAEASREEKLHTFPVLPTLLAKLAKRVEEEAQQAEDLLFSVMAQLPLKKKGGA